MGEDTGDAKLLVREAGAAERAKKGISDQGCNSLILRKESASGYAKNTRILEGTVGLD